MSQEDAMHARAILKRHGWDAYHYRDPMSLRTWYITACWPPMQITADEMGAPDAAWYTIHNPREAVRAVCFYSAIERREEPA